MLKRFSQSFDLLTVHFTQNLEPPFGFFLGSERSLRHTYTEALLRVAWELEVRAGGGGGKTPKKASSKKPGSTKKHLEVNLEVSLEKLLSDAVEKYIIPNIKAINSIEIFRFTS